MLLTRCELLEILPYPTLPTGGASDAKPFFFAVGVRAFTFTKVRETRLCKLLKIEARRERIKCAGLEVHKPNTGAHLHVYLKLWCLNIE